MSVTGYKSENTDVALLANASGFETIQDGILDEFLFAEYIICMSISEAGDVTILCFCSHSILIARLWGITAAGVRKAYPASHMSQ